MTQQDPENIYSTLKNYDIDRQIGKGQFSCVYKAKNKIDGTIVALKKVQVSSLCLWLLYNGEVSMSIKVL